MVAWKESHARSNMAGTYLGLLLLQLLLLSLAAAGKEARSQAMLQGCLMRRQVLHCHGRLLRGHIACVSAQKGLALT